MRLDPYESHGAAREPRRAEEPGGPRPRVPRRVVLRSSVGGVALVLDEEVVAEAREVEELVEVTRQLGDSDAFALGRGDAAELEPGIARAPVLAALRPSDELAEELYEEWGSGEIGDASLDEPSIAAGNTLNGEPWAWTRITNDSWRPTPNDEGWALVPAGPGRELARFDAWQAESMSGGIYTAGVRRWTNDAAVCWHRADEDGLVWSAVHYDLADWWRLLAATAKHWCGRDGEPSCPTCQSEAGWEVTVTVDQGLLGAEVIARLTDLLWRPCPKHSGAPAPGV